MNRLRHRLFWAIERADARAHARHAPKWIQIPLCDLLDLACGLTWTELRRQRQH